MKKFFTLILVLNVIAITAQDLAFGRKMVDTLTSSYFWGRGYTNDGMKKAADFLRFAGQEVQIKLRIPVGNQRNFTGVIAGCLDDKVTLKVGAGASQTDLVFALATVDKARLVPKF